MEARFILNNSLAGLNEDLYFINDLLLKPKPADIHLHDLEHRFQNLTSRVSQFFLDYKATKELFSVRDTKEILEKFNVTLKTGIKNLEAGNKVENQTTFTFMNNNSWSHIDFSRTVSNALAAINSKENAHEEDITPENKDEELCQPIIVLEIAHECNSISQSIPKVILEVTPNVILDVTHSNQRSSQIEINQNLEKVKNLCANQKIMRRNDSMSLVAKIINENNFSRTLGIISDRLGDNYKIDRFMINNLLSKKTTLENDWECKDYLFNILTKGDDADAHTFSCFIKSAGEHKHYAPALSAFEIAKQNPCHLNSYTYFAIITAAIDNNELQEAKLLIKKASEKGILNDYTRRAISEKLMAAIKK